MERVMRIDVQMMELSGVSYDDGSSTESEYYFELTDELEGEEAAHTLVHQYDASVTQEPFNELKPRRKEDNLECKSYRFEIKECGEISLPQGSEWSHGVASIVSNNTAVERALTIARGLTRTRQRYDALMTDTTISNASPVETKTRIETKMKTVILKKRKKVDVKLEVGSPKRVKATLSPALVTKPMDGEMKHSLENEVKEPSEMEKELACTHSQWELTGSQARLKATEIENDTLLLEMQLERHRETKSEMIASSRRTERTARRSHKKRLVASDPFLKKKSKQISSTKSTKRGETDKIKIKIHV
ncbi:hypothetical protein KXD40_008907 [Peronospora effusa]|nr:hypothetical protein KXD40_008907 [Peronospora effusa]